MRVVSHEISEAKVLKLRKLYEEVLGKHPGVNFEENLKQDPLDVGNLWSLAKQKIAGKISDDELSQPDENLLDDWFWGEDLPSKMASLSRKGQDEPMNAYSPSGATTYSEVLRGLTEKEKNDWLHHPRRWYGTWAKWRESLKSMHGGESLWEPSSKLPWDMLTEWWKHRPEDNLLKNLVLNDRVACEDFLEPERVSLIQIHDYKSHTEVELNGSWLAEKETVWAEWWNEGLGGMPKTIFMKKRMWEQPWAIRAMGSIKKSHESWGREDWWVHSVLNCTKDSADFLRSYQGLKVVTLLRTSANESRVKEALLKINTSITKIELSNEIQSILLSSSMSADPKAKRKAL